MMISRFPLLLVAMAGGYTQAQVQRQPSPITVCQMLDLGPDHEVVVRGEIFGTPEHGYFLDQGIGGDPCPGWRKRFFTSSSSTAIAFFSSHGVRLSTEEERLNRELLQRLGRFSDGHVVQRYKVTVSGVLVRRPSPLIFRRTNGGYVCKTFEPTEAECFGVFLLKSIIQEEAR
jgi:hypothetical protein